MLDSIGNGMSQTEVRTLNFHNSLADRDFWHMWQDELDKYSKEGFVKCFDVSDTIVVLIKKEKQETKNVISH